MHNELLVALNQDPRGNRQKSAENVDGLVDEWPGLCIGCHAILVPLGVCSSFTCSEAIDKQ